MRYTCIVLDQPWRITALNYTPYRPPYSLLHSLRSLPDLMHNLMLLMTRRVHTEEFCYNYKITVINSHSCQKKTFNVTKKNLIKYTD